MAVGDRCRSHRHGLRLGGRGVLAGVVGVIPRGNHHDDAGAHGVRHGLVGRGSEPPAKAQVGDALGGLSLERLLAVLNNVVDAADHPAPRAPAVPSKNLDGAEDIARGDAVIDAAGRAGDMGAV